MKRDVTAMSVPELYVAEQAALMRLQLYATGKTHEILAAIAGQLREALRDAGGEAGQIGAVGLTRFMQQDLPLIWRTGFDQWLTVFAALRREAAGLAFSGLALQHAAYFGPARAALEDDARAADMAHDHFGPARAALEEAVTPPAIGVAAIPFYTQQLDAVLEAANERLYGDGFKLSQRIWRHDEQSLNGIRQAVFQGVERGSSAWQIAQAVEQYLGAGQDCPRWTRTRLYGLTKQDIADGDRTGLLTGEACAGQGVSYNALRLARTEIQYAHALATDRVMAQQPWVTAERVHLSPAHPDIGCECEDVVAGGETGDGTYPKGTIALPLHPHCLCWKEGVLLSEDDFVARLRGWETGAATWPEMDEYARWVGMSPRSFESPFLAGLGVGLQMWLWGDEKSLGERLIAAGAVLEPLANIVREGEADE